MEVSDSAFVSVNLPKLSSEDIIKILHLFKFELDKRKARIEKPGIGTYLYINKLPPAIIKELRKCIEELL
jgi:hypothetical protein